MLIATPYRDFEARDKSPPRVISEIRKSYINFCSPLSYRPKLTGNLLLKCGNERDWWPRRVSVRCGQLLVSMSHGEDGPTSIRLPLRHLSLQVGPLPNSISLLKGQNIVLTLQTPNERAFDEWVKTIAIELIRQTPLDAIKYLDILTIADCWKRREENYERDWNFNNWKPPTEGTLNNCGTCYNKCQKTEELPLRSARIPDKSDETVKVVEEKQVEDLLKKCQNAETYVPVKEKLMLFESLCKLGRKVRSTEDVSLKKEISHNRARSLHDLTKINSHIAVREICKYFENKNDAQDNNTVVNYKSGRLVHSDSQLNDVYKFRKVFIT